MIMDMKPIRRLTASLLRHRAAPWLCALAVLALTSCGDFFEFGEERATWDGKIICQNDSSVVMVGDTKYDILGAKAHGIPAIGVGWGYGDTAEMKQAGAVGIADSMEQLLGLIRGM